MIHLKKYQEEAVNDLTTTTYKLLKKSGVRHPLVFKAPTGAGKTVMMGAYLNKLCEELPDKLDIEKRKATFIWIAPNKLYIQSYKALKGYFEELRSLKPVFFEDLTGNTLQPNEILFVNWESINKEKNLMVRENEQGRTLYNYVNQARLDDTEIIVIIDEEHLFASPKTAKRAAEVLQKIYPKIEIRVSATPVTNSDYKTIVERQDVIDEEMIKEGILLNPKIDKHEQKSGESADQTLIDIALEKRQELADEYKQLGININPLLLIQLPNDTNEDITADDKKYIDAVIFHLENAHGISVNNHRLAIWLSGKRENVDGIEALNGMVDVLLFKQAIALGWDCPRSAVLLIFRELKSTTFSIQTVGRILRMPQQKHYPNAMLNQGYVFTNLSKDMIEVVKDDMSYISSNRAIRKEDYAPIELNSTFINIRLVRNRLGSKFRIALYQTAEELWNVSRELREEGIFEFNRTCLRQRLIHLEVSKIEITIPENVNLTGETQVVMAQEKARFAKTPSELNKLFHQFCRANIGSFAPVDSTPALEMALKMFFEEYLNYGELDTVKIILYPQNQPAFIELIAKSLELYTQMLEEKASKAQKNIQTYTWEVPAERVYNENYEEAAQEIHILEPYYESVKASKPEKSFANYLETNSEHIAWWYKNGESAKEHFAIPYINYLGKESLFYVDFVILTKSKVTCLFDTKTAGSDAANAHLKHNALIDYIATRNTQGKKTIGGIIIGNELNGTWRHCQNKIENTVDKTGWDFFNPSIL